MLFIETKTLKLM